MKRSEAIFNILKILVDVAMILLGFAVAYYARLHAFDFVPVKWMLPFGQYLIYIGYSMVLWVAIFAVFGLYTFQGVGNWFVEFGKSVLAVSATLSLMIITIFFNRDQFFSRLIIIYAWVFVTLFVVLGRLVMRMIQNYMYKYGIGVRKVVIVGGNGKVMDLVEYFDKHRNDGWELVGLVDEKKSKGELVGGYKVLGSVSKLGKINKKYDLDEVWMAETKKSRSMTVELIKFCHDHELVFRFVPSIVEVVSANVETQTVSGIPLIAMKETALEGWGRIIKRIFDVTFSLIVIVFLSPLLLLVAILIMLDSKGPVFYRSVRVGRKGKLFTIYKFRSMVVDAEKKLQDLKDQNEADGPMFKIKDDPRITRMGKFLRKSRIDELPQVWNVLKGEMSWIGPRPPIPAEVEQYEKHHLKRLAIKSGITGPWQVTGRHDLSFEDIVKLDTYYIENWSMALDAQIFFKTIWLMLTKAGR